MENHTIVVTGASAGSGYSYRGVSLRTNGKRNSFLITLTTESYERGVYQSFDRQKALDKYRWYCSQYGIA